MALRHGCATALYEAGVDLGTVARFLRHRDLSAVNRYVHASTDRIRQEIEDRLGTQDANALTSNGLGPSSRAVQHLPDSLYRRGLPVTRGV